MRTVPMSTTVRITVFAPANAPGSRLRRLTKPSMGERTVVFDSVIFSSSMRNCVCDCCAFATFNCETAAL